MAPPIIAFLAQSPLVDKYDITSVRSIASAGAALSPSLVVAARKRFVAAGVKESEIHIVQALGTTEMSALTSNYVLSFLSIIISTIVLRVASLRLVD